jgi:gamma-glutamyl hercynylcysteine S-oxide synthase
MIDQVSLSSANSTTNARLLSGNGLAEALRNSRARTWALVDDLTPAQWQPPYQVGVNPVAWELAHLAWFAEFWILRGPHNRSAQGHALAHKAPLFSGPDALFDSARLSHAARWTERMPARPELESMLREQLEACTSAIDGLDDPSLYFHRLALFHEDMHGEALCWMRSALGYPAPVGAKMPLLPISSRLAFAACEIRMGYAQDAPGFAFDNEQAGKTVSLSGFEIDSCPVSACEYAKFVEAGGYNRAEYWPGEAGIWRTRANLPHPSHWRRNAGEWQTRWFDQWLPISTHDPAMHLNAYEAQAFCLWAGRRLPSAAEWEHAAQSCEEFEWGHSVWEWTSDPFEPYPGFAPGPYQEYSQPWFGNHRELRGGAFATHTRMHNPRYRNFFLPQRSDIFSGFRTVAL